MNLASFWEFFIFSQNKISSVRPRLRRLQQGFYTNQRFKKKLIAIFITFLLKVKQIGWYFTNSATN